LLGGPIRDRIRVYWSHCGTYRLQWWKEMELPPLRTLDDVVALGKEVVAKGYSALKTNAFMLGADPYLHSPGFARRGPGFPELNAERPVLRAMRDQLDIFWVEIDTRSPQALAGIRRGTTIPVASCECLFGRRDFKPFFDAQAVDVAIVDTPWNGVAESVKIASMADV
jgi:L-alanine-DL-glutamate epimerase-like enolase superfamily enzyme